MEYIKSNKGGVKLLYEGLGLGLERGKYKAVNERLVTVVRDYANRSVHDFLRGIAHNIQM